MWTQARWTMWWEWWFRLSICIVSWYVITYAFFCFSLSWEDLDWFFLGTIIHGSCPVYALPPEWSWILWRSFHSNNFYLFIASTSSPSSPPLVISMPTTCIMAVRTRLNEGTESADNKVTKLQGGLRHVRMAKAMSRYLNYRLIEMLCLLTRILASNAIAVNTTDMKATSSSCWRLIWVGWVSTCRQQILSCCTTATK